MRIHYCYQIGSTFTNLGLMEDSIVRAMSMCDRIKLATFLGADASNWARMEAKTGQLRDSTLGILIAILSKHDVPANDIGYLKWIKAKRDFFVHRFFGEGAWPGDLDEAAIDIMCRRLLYLEIIFRRASHAIWRIFGRAGLVECQDLGTDGYLIMNLDLLADDNDSDDQVQ
jgi:hypothetical protein